MKYCLHIGKLMIAILICFSPAKAQPTISENFVISTSVKQPGIFHEASLNDTGAADNIKSETIIYFDGLGRPLQTIIIKGSASQKDLITPTEYDHLGREVKKYLPYADILSTSYGSYKADWVTRQPAFYNGLLEGVQPDVMPYEQKVFESSPLKRILAKGAPGISWQPNMTDAYDTTKKTVREKFETNLLTDNVVVWNVATSTVAFNISQITRNGYYSGGQLKVKITINEQGNAIKEFTDKDGQLILKRVQDNTGWAETYYIYEDFGRLAAVIQPEGVAALPATLNYTFANKWMFLYRYDERGRMVMKKVPGADSVVMAYDQWDRLVLTQDGIQRSKANKEWLFTKYDYMNRPIMTGIYVSNSSHSTIRNLLATSMQRFESINTNAAEGYTLSYCFPTSYQELLTITHYDSYDKLPSWKSSYSFVSENGITTYHNLTIGLEIASQVRVLGTANWLKMVTYFDEEGRPIQTIGDNIKSGKDRITKKVMWDGKPVEQWQSHTSTFFSAPIVLKKKFAYDHADRIITVKHQVNAQEEVTIITNSYNEPGQLLSKKLHTSNAKPTGLQTLDYGYNIRGWLVNVNRVENIAGITAYDANDLFAFELNYNSTSLPGAGAWYNGNISEQKWKGPLAETPCGFVYSYDKLNRLLGAVSADKPGSSWTINNKYDEKNITYDKNGNIKTLARYENGTAIDNLSYGTYLGNQLIKVEDGGDASLSFKNGVNSATEYYYDANGSMYKDDNKGISNIVYNYLKLPATISVTNKGTINYLYDARGNKVRKISYDLQTNISDTTWYAGHFEYTKDTLQLINFDEGRLRPVKINGNAAAAASNFKYVYDYFLKDHLGNVRLVITSGNDTIVYSATMEDANTLVEDQLFSNISGTKSTKPAGFDNTGTNLKVSKLNGDLNTTGNKRIGPAIILKVMAGDTISVATQVWYSGVVQSAPTGLVPILTELVSLLTTGIINTGGGKGGLFSTAGINTASSTAVNSFLTNNQAYNATKPKAYLNWMVLDEQFVAVNSSGHLGAVQVPIISAGTQKQQLVGPVNMVVQRSGFLYVFVSNESNMNVYFDDVVVNHKIGPVLEVTNYFPFGVTMIGLSSKAGVSLENKRKFNEGSELQNREFSVGSGLELYDVINRMYDPQLGKFCQVDEIAEAHWEMSLYNFAADNPIRFNDPYGLEEGDPNNPKVLPEVIVKAVRKLESNQMQSLYWQMRNEGNGFGGLNDKLRGRLERWDAIQRYMEKIHKQTREQDEIVLEIAANFIPLGWISKLKFIKYATNLFKFKRGLSAVSKSKPLITVLGKLGEYETIAAEMKYNSFNIAPEVALTMTQTARMAENMKFLAEAVARGDEFVFSHRVAAISAETGRFRVELEYLVENGYRLAADGLGMIK